MSDDLRVLPFPLMPSYLVREDGVVMRGGTIRKPYPMKRGGYLALSLWENGKNRTIQVHIIVALTFHGPRPSKQHDAAHNDGNKLNCSASNLAWKTRAENEADKIAHGTSNRGERNGMNKLSAEQVKAVRADGRVQRIIAAEYGIHQSAVSYIKSGRNWGTL